MPLPETQLVVDRESAASRGTHCFRKVVFAKEWNISLSLGNVNSARAASEVLKTTSSSELMGLVL